MPDIQLAASSVSLVVAPEHGGRLSSLKIAGRELLVVAPTNESLQWGSYPMVPWAGRIREGLFKHRDITYEMPCNLPPHSAHGTGFISKWSVVDDATIALDLGPPWPFGGRVTQHFALSDDDLVITMGVTADVEMPVMVGWHPWFARYLPAADSGLEQVEAELRFSPGQMYELDESAIPTGELVAPPPGPWDNCFTSLAGPPTIRWPGIVDLQLESSCDHWVVYTEPEHALCVEPQSGPPDVFNSHPPIVDAGETYEAWFRLSWS